MDALAGGAANWLGALTTLGRKWTENRSLWSRLRIDASQFFSH